MTIYKKFNNYLLTHQPLLWHTRLIQLVSTMVLLNAVFYFLGSGSVDLKKLSEDGYMSRYFYDDLYALFWIISGLVILIVWSISFYRFNAAKNFYPISRWYFHKMALSLFIPLVLFFLIPFSFHAGATNKARGIVNIEQLYELSYYRHYSKPFLLFDEDYGFRNRRYPDVYNHAIFFDVNSEEDDDRLVFFRDSLWRITHVLNAVDAQSIVDSCRIFAYSVDHVPEMTIIGTDTCYHSENYFLHALNRDSLVDFHWKHVKNYNPSFSYIDFYFFENTIKNSALVGAIYDENAFDSYHTMKIAHEWIDKDRDKILATLQYFVELLKKYEIENDLNPEKTYKYLIDNNFNFYEELCLFYEPGEYDLDFYSYEDYNGDYDYDTLEYTPKYLGEGHFYQYLNQEKLDTLIDNASIANFWTYFYDGEQVLFFLFFSLVVTMLLLFFQWGNLISFFISIPVAGVLVILGVVSFYVLFGMFSYSSYEYEYYWVSAMGFFMFLFIALLVLIVAIRGMKQIWNTYITDVAIILSYFAAPLWMNAVLFFIYNILTVNVMDPCNGYDTTLEPFNTNSPLFQTIIIGSPFVLFFVSLFFIKGIVAKKVG